MDYKERGMEIEVLFGVFCGGIMGMIYFVGQDLKRSAVEIPDVVGIVVIAGMCMCLTWIVWYEFDRQLEVGRFTQDSGALLPWVWLTAYSTAIGIGIGGTHLLYWLDDRRRKVHPSI